MSFTATSAKNPGGPKAIFIGYTNIDVNVTPEGKVVLPGGGAYFSSLAASLYLKPVGLVTRIGKDYDPSFLFSRVLKEGIKIVKDKLTARSTQTYHSSTDLTDRSIELDWGVNPDFVPEDIPAHWLSNAEFVHISTMLPLQQKKFLQYIKKNAPHLTISMDTDMCFLNDPQHKQDIVSNYKSADLGFLNRREFDVLKNDLLHSLNLVVKKDKDGVDYYEQGKRIHSVAANPVKAADATGAGDIFAGAFMTNLALGKNVKDALMKANLLASLSVTEQGVDHLFRA